MKRSESVSCRKRNDDLLEAIKILKGDHPFWGYRRVWSYLKYREGYSINKKRVYRLMKLHGYLVTKELRRTAKRGPVRPKPRAERPNQFWGTDMTKIKISTWGWFYLVIVLDWYTKEIVGYSLNIQSKSQDWLNALDVAIQNRFPEGIREANPQLKLITDNGCQPTSEAYMKHCSLLGIKQIFTTWSNPKGNADTERVIRTLKEDAVWPYDWNNPFDLIDKLDQWIKDYNEDFPHQTLKNLTPKQFMEKQTQKLEPVLA